VVQDHAGGAPARLSWIRRAIWRRALAAADGFLFTAVEQAASWRRHGLIAPHQAVYPVVEASTTPEPLPPDGAKRVSGVDGAPAILWVGRLNANKDPMTVLDGFEQALARLPGARLTMIYSDGDLLPSVRDRVDSSDALAKHVRLAGRIPFEDMA